MHRKTDPAGEPRVPALSVSVLFDAAAGTHPGWRYAENQDAVLLGRRVWQKPLIRTCVDRPRLLAAVADGVAFAPCAARASRMVLEELARFMEARGGLDASAPRDIHRAMASRAAGTACAGMAATLAAVEFTEAQVRIVSVGDSRVYRYRAGQLLPLTVDHTLARRLVRTGELTQAQADRAGDLYQDLDSALVASESETEFEIHHATSDLCAGDRWLCCTDGFTHVLPDARLAMRLEAAAMPADAVRAILDDARRSRDGDDNLSAIVVMARLSAAARRDR